jgi:two-component system sensor histidine kinase/response regulator
MNDHVTKPFEAAQLFEVLLKWIRPAAPQAQAPSPGSASGISFELGLQRCLGRPKLYRKILDRFATSRTGDPAPIASALEAGELERASLIVHNVISSAGTIGAEGLSDAARALQVAIELGESGRWADLLADLGRHHAVVASQLSGYLEALAQTPMDSVTASGAG